MELFTQQNGQYIAAGVIEVIAIPHFDLLATMPEEAVARVDATFLGMLSGFANRVVDGSAAYEMLMVSEPASNQLYLAQPHVFIIVRKAAGSLALAQMFVEDSIHDITAALQQLGYSYKVVNGGDKRFDRLLSGVRAESAFAMSRDERCLQVGPSLLYQNDILPQDALRNSAQVTNALTGHPWSAISFQLIPVQLSQQEVTLVEAMRMQVDAARRTLMMTPGMTSPTAYIEASQSYQSFLASAKEAQAIFIPVIWGPMASVPSLANAVSSYLSGMSGESSVRQLSGGAALGSPAKDFLVRPWIISDEMIFELRDKAFWQRAGGLAQLKRLRQIIPISFAKALVRPPVDDDTAVGLKTKRSIVTRERLRDEILSPESFRLGTLMDAGGFEGVASEEAQQAGIPNLRLAQHGLIVGKPGYGKTNFVHSLMLRLAERKIPFLAIEPTKSEYRTLIGAIPDLLVFTPGNNKVSPFFINPFIPPKGCTVQSYIPSLMDAFQTAFTLPDPLPAILREVINKTYNIYGWRLDSTSDDSEAKPFGFHELIRVFQSHVDSMDYKGEVKENINTAGVLRLSSLIAQNADIYDTSKTIPIEELLERNVVLELNAITSKEEKTLLMALVLVDVCLFTKFNRKFGDHRQNMLLVDEAHVLFGDAQGMDGVNHAAEALEDMIKEIRAYGTGVFLADQSPATFGPGVITCTDNKFMFNLSDSVSKDILRSAARLSDQDVQELGRLGTGEFLFHCGILMEPIKLKADYAHGIASYPTDVSDDELAARDEFWQKHRSLLMPFAECSVCTTCRERGCDLALRSKAEFMATRLANYYRAATKTDEQLLSYVANRAESDVTRQLTTQHITSDRKRAGYCVLTRFMRRTLRDNRHTLSNADLARCQRTFAKFSYEDSIDAAVGDASKRG